MPTVLAASRAGPKLIILRGIISTRHSLIRNRMTGRITNLPITAEKVFSNLERKY